MDFKSSTTGSTPVSVPESAVLLSSSVLSRNAYLCEDVGDEGRCLFPLLKSPDVWQDLMPQSTSTMLARQQCFHLVPRYRSFCWIPLLVVTSHATPTKNMEQVTVDTYYTSQVAYSVPALKSKLYYDRRSVGQSVLVSGTHLGPSTNFPPSLFNYFLTVAGLLLWGALSDEKSGL
jgi:hypothetical protein